MKKILLIEDNKHIRMNTAEILELSGYQVETAENGKDGITKAIQYKPDLIICDIMMPVLDGYAVLHAVHQHEYIRHIPFIFLTAKAERSEFRKGMELGADDYITKPFTGTELLDAVSGRLKKAELQKKEPSAGSKNSEQKKVAASGKDPLAFLIHNRNTNRYKRKQMIYTEGNHPGYLYYVLKGKIKAYKTNENGKEFVTELYGPGDFLGHIALLKDSRYNDTAMTLEETEVAVIPRDDFFKLIHKNPEASGKFIKLLARNVSEKETQLLGLAYNSLRKKVAEALLQFRRKFNQKKDEKFVIDINRENLSVIAGTATESLIRTLSDFRNEKLIDMKGGDIIIINEDKLKQLTN